MEEKHLESHDLYSCLSHNTIATTLCNTSKTITLPLRFFVTNESGNPEYFWWISSDASSKGIQENDLNIILSESCLWKTFRDVENVLPRSDSPIDVFTSFHHLQQHLNTQFLVKQSRRSSFQKFLHDCGVWSSHTKCLQLFSTFGSIIDQPLHMLFPKPDNTVVKIKSPAVRDLDADQHTYIFISMLLFWNQELIMGDYLKQKFIDVLGKLEKQDVWNQYGYKNSFIIFKGRTVPPWMILDTHKQLIPVIQQYQRIRDKPISPTVSMTFSVNKRKTRSTCPRKRKKSRW